jgi:hypothetical protein
MASDSLEATFARLREPVTVTLTLSEWKSVLATLDKPVPARASDATRRFHAHVRAIAEKLTAQVYGTILETRGGTDGH